MNKIDNIVEIKTDSNLKNHVLNYKITIFRNFDSIPFVNKLTSEQKDMLDGELSSFLEKRKKIFKTDKLSNIPSSEVDLMRNNGLLDLAIQDGKTRISYTNDTVIVFNHINHVTITGIGTDILKIFKRIVELEQKFIDFSPYLVNTRYGYMSPGINNCGLGIKLCVLVHLSGIAKSGKFDAMKSIAYERGYGIDRWYSDSENADFYAVSSRLNYGLTENELIERFIAGIKDILTMEKEILNDYYYDNSDIDDEIYRSIGILKYARKLSNGEMISHLSMIRTGLKLNRKLPVSLKKINQIHSSMLETCFLKENELVERASIVRLLMEDSNV
ncbi:MAG: hypothetical protein A2015_01180 [Spirochaetes bacterium GWF1_31_7]|nr:MAG: hypothetical protein A2Y30_01080 [Spirochaetes bacterium GWE1_32_154]OHD47910.1 MAG: hypothetical protein A2015_01180 [Spirochaetes bacterium GWF1_31_7]OHD48902.1 MAG: hypothetical protein A2Y29_16895 [Spirochaetes bacterium GWE2_31_10]HBD93603.1 hypothetical protein [Spirochaetia bacterium]HBI38070.1 hypothetical protein [Spirochaetia bacterium]